MGDQLVGRAEPLQDHHRLVAGRGLDGELDVAEHPVGMRVGDEQWAAISGGCCGELVAIDQAYTGLDRIDIESSEGDVEERHRRQDDAARELRRRIQDRFEQDHIRWSGVQRMEVVGSESPLYSQKPSSQ